MNEVQAQELAGEAAAAAYKLAGEWLLIKRERDEAVQFSAKLMLSGVSELNKIERELNEARAEVKRQRVALAKAKAAGPPISIQEIVDNGSLNPFALKLVGESFKLTQRNPVIFEFDGVVFHLAHSVIGENSDG